MMLLISGDIAKDDIIVAAPVRFTMATEVSESANQDEYM